MFCTRGGRSWKRRLDSYGCAAAKNVGTMFELDDDVLTNVVRAPTRLYLPRLSARNRGKFATFVLFLLLAL
jgi:hypothetical protein